MTWVLVLYIYAGALARGDSVAVSSIDGFQSKAACENAGRSASPLVANSAKELRFVCVSK